MNNIRKTVLITGAAKRLGRAMAMAFADAGYNVAIHYSTSESDAASLKSGIISRHGAGSAEIFKARLKSQSEIEALPGDVVRTFGGLNVLVNNASIFEKTPLDEIGAESFEKFNSIHVTAPALLSLACATHLRKSPPGRIINMVDVYADFSKREYLPYTVSKAGLKSLTKNLAVELAPDILVNAIAPGAILAPVSDEKPEVIQSILARIPLKKFGQPEDIAKAALFLAETDYITGQTIVIDGGRSLTI